MRSIKTIDPFDEKMNCAEAYAVLDATGTAEVPSAS
jgi:hypothetical protein